MQRSLELLDTLTQCDGVPGFEDEVRTAFRQELARIGEIENDRTGSVVCRKQGTVERPRVMLDCHLDEVGFIIQHITKEGFLKFLPLGGWWNHILPAQRVRVQAGDDRIVGLIGSTPPHFLPEERRKQVLETKDLFIDIGAATREEAASWGVRVGSWAVPISPFRRLRNDKLCVGKAFDNRVGCALCIEAVEQANGHPNTIFAAGSVQEEVGLRGATTSVSVIKPDVALVLECPPADDTPGFTREESQAALGAGVQIRAFDPTMVANPRLVELAIRTAREHEIPHQLAVRAAGGTDAGRIHLHERGVPAVVLGVPARYIHAHAGIIHLDDYQAALRLVLELLKRLDAETVAAL